MIKANAFNKLCVARFFLLLTLASCTVNKYRNTKSFVDLRGSEVIKDTFDTFLKARKDTLKIPGLSIFIIDKGRIVHHKNLGFADVEKRLPITSKTIFEGASLSKSVFAFFVMIYVEEGKLELDKPLFEYYPHPDLTYDERHKLITARMVLSHRSGLPNWRGNDGKDSLKLKFTPGTSYEYSGEAYQYLATVLKHIDGVDWKGLEASFQKKIARPLGMKHTVFMQDAYTRENKARPYDENGMFIDPQKDSYWISRANSEFGAPYSIHSNALDFSKWMICVMKEELLQRQSYSELFKNHSQLPSDSTEELYYTLGFVNIKFPKAQTAIYAHGGNNMGFTCLYLLDIEKDWGYIVFTNSEKGEQLGGEILDYLFPLKYR